MNILFIQEQIIKILNLDVGEMSATKFVQSWDIASQALDLILYNDYTVEMIKVDDIYTVTAARWDDSDEDEDGIFDYSFSSGKLLSRTILEVLLKLNV